MALTAQSYADTPLRQLEQLESAPDEDRGGKVPGYYRHHRRLSAAYSGYVIQLIISDLPLRRDYHLFEQFGSIFVDQLPGGGYAYCLKINFNEEAAIQQFLHTIIRPKVPNAKIIRYKKGVRKTS